MTKQKGFSKTYQSMSQICRSWQFIEPNTSSSLDCLLNELRPGTLTVFAGAVAMGANCLSMIALDDFARRAPCRYPAICVDLLNRDDFCFNRILRREAYQQTGKLYLNCSANELTACKNTLEHVPIVINNSISDMVALETLLKDVINANGGISMIMVCGIDALLADKDIIAKLKRLSFDMDVPVVITYILDEGVNTRNNHRPLLSDLSNDIRKNANTIVLTSRPSYYSYEPDLNQNMDILMYKQDTLVMQYTFLVADLDCAIVNHVY